MDVPNEILPFGDLTAEETYAEYRKMQGMDSQWMFFHLINLFFCAGQTGDQKVLSKAELWKREFGRRCVVVGLFG